MPFLTDMFRKPALPYPVGRLGLKGNRRKLVLGMSILPKKVDYQKRGCDLESRNCGMNRILLQTENGAM